MTETPVVLLSADTDVAQNCSDVLRHLGYRSIVASHLPDAIGLIEETRPDLILLDLDAPGVNPIEMVRHAHEVGGHIPVILLTTLTSLERAVTVLKEGAYAYVPKQFLLEQIRPLIERAAEQRRQALEKRTFHNELEGTFGFEKIVGRSPELLRALERARKGAQSDANILVLGESGTGKELLARAIHANSRRAADPFVAVDCAALPENLLESELFGYERGAFTGAIKTKPGLMELAHMGTLFLDEIAELPVQLQVKLLRAVQEKSHRRLGGIQTVEFDGRLVCATNRDLPAMVQRGQFREDLFYRINVIPIRLPALRERRGDIPLLASVLLRKFCDKGGVAGGKNFDANVIRIFEAYPWPGNVRELQNVVEYACALSDHEVINPDDLPENLSGQRGNSTTTFQRAHAHVTAEITLHRARALWTEEFEKSYLTSLLHTYGDNLSRAARAAGVDRKTMRRLLNKYSLR